jgi:WD40 repeat protein
MSSTCVAQPGQPYEDYLWSLFRALREKRQTYLAALPREIFNELMRFDFHNRWLDSGAPIKDLHKMTHNDEVTALLLNEEKDTFITVTEDGALREFSVKTGALIRSAEIGKPEEEGRTQESIWSLAKCGDYLFLASQHGLVYKFDYPSFTKLGSTTVSNGYAKVRGCDKKLFVASYKSFVVLDPETMKEVHKFTDVPYAPAALSMKDNMVACDMWTDENRRKNCIHLYSVTDYKLVKKFEAPPTVFSTQISGPYLLAGLNSGDISVYSIETGEKLRTLTHHKKLVYALDAYGSTLVTGSNDREAAVWDMRDWKMVKQLKGHSGWVNSLRLYKDRIITASHDKTVTIWTLMAEDGQSSWASAFDKVISTVTNLLPANHK